jgi:hypothetical protein
MVDLQLQRAVSEGAAALHAFCAADAQLLIDGIFKEGIFDEFSFYRIGRTELVFRRRGKVLGFGLEITSAEITISTHGINVKTLYCRR